MRKKLDFQIFDRKSISIPYDWCNFRIFSFTGSGNDKEIINEFIKSKYYKVSFVCPYENEKYDIDYHGPYFIDKITEDKYVKINNEIITNALKIVIINESYVYKNGKDQHLSEKIKPTENKNIDYNTIINEYKNIWKTDKRANVMQMDYDEFDKFLEQYNSIINDLLTENTNTYYLDLNYENKEYLTECYWVLTYFYDYILIDYKNSKLINITFGLD